MIDVLTSMAIIRPSEQVAAAGPIRFDQSGPAYYVAVRDLATSVEARYQWNKRELLFWVHYADPAPQPIDMVEIPQLHPTKPRGELALGIDVQRRRVQRLRVSELDIEETEPQELIEALRQACDRYWTEFGKD